MISVSGRSPWCTSLWDSIASVRLLTCQHNLNEKNLLEGIGISVDLVVVCTDSWDNSCDSNKNTNIDLKKKEQDSVRKVSTDCVIGANCPRSVRYKYNRKLELCVLYLFGITGFQFWTGIVWPLLIDFPLPTVGSSCLCFLSFRNSPCLFRIRLDCYIASKLKKCSGSLLYKEIL